MRRGESAEKGDLECQRQAKLTSQVGPFSVGRGPRGNHTALPPLPAIPFKVCLCDLRVSYPWIEITPGIISIFYTESNSTRE